MSIHPNFITGPNTATPLDLVDVATSGCLGYPAKVRQRALHILPRRRIPTGVMAFDYAATMARDEQAEIAACKAAGTVLDFYLGAKALPPTRADRRKVLNRYQGCGRLIFDQVADDAPDSDEADLLRQCLSLGFDVGLEANRKQDWITALMDRYGPRITICGNWWMWENTKGRRYTTDDVRALGGKSLVLVTFATPDNDELAWWNDHPTELAAFKVAKALEWAQEADDVAVRMTGLLPNQLMSLEAGRAIG